MPIGPIGCREGVWRPTGQRRYRTTWFGRLVLQIEVAERTGSVNGGREVSWTGRNVRWRDADVFDLQVSAQHEQARHETRD